ncbi:MAG: DUF1836 domain-containing protein [Lachnospiraceae bacterium]|nr:DUF1836 domain-containing protein [Lachnospiraceae bacterium]
MSATDYTNIKNIGRLFRRLADLGYIHPEEIPSIDLYMDQVTTFMDEHLKTSKRFDTDKILTKTMINNYAKNNLLPPPVKKKYSKDHMILLIFIYYMKNIMSIGDIQELLNPISEQYFDGKGEIPLTEIYLEIMNFLKQEQDGLFRYVKNEFRSSETLFCDTSADIPEEEREDLRRFAFICYLAFDVYLKKLMIETLIDDSKPAAKKGPESKSSEKASKKQ